MSQTQETIINLNIKGLSDLDKLNIGLDALGNKRKAIDGLNSSTNGLKSAFDVVNSSLNIASSSGDKFINKLLSIRFPEVGQMAEKEMKILYQAFSQAERIGPEMFDMASLAAKVFKGDMNQVNLAITQYNELFEKNTGVDGITLNTSALLALRNQVIATGSSISTLNKEINGLANNNINNISKSLDLSVKSLEKFILFDSDLNAFALDTEKFNIHLQEMSSNLSAAADFASKARSSFTEEESILNESTQAVAKYDSSITGLNQRLSLLVASYKSLGAAEREGASGKALIADIELLKKEAASAELELNRLGIAATKGRGHFDPLTNSIMQVSRELPNFAISANIGFMAISNNLPILADAVTNFRKMREEALANGQAYPTMFQSIKSGMLGLGGVVTLLSGLMIAFGDKAIDYVIKKLNEIPKELEIKLKLEEESLKQTEKAREVIKELQHDLDIINGKNDKISLNQLKNIKNVMIQQGIATKDELKGLDTKAEAYNKYFTRYLEKVKQTAKEEAIIKAKANAEINAEIVKTQQELILEQVKQTIHTNEGDEKYLAKFIDDWKKGNISSAVIIQKGLVGLSNRWNDTVDKQKEANEELKLYSKLYKDIQNTQNKAGNNPFLIEPIKNQTKEKKKKEKIDFGLPIDQQVYNNVIESLSKFNEDLRKKQDEESKKNQEGWVKMTTPSLDDLKDPFDHLQWLYDNDYSTYDEFLKAKLELLQQYGLDTNKIQNEINARQLQGIQQTISSLANLSNAIAGLYQGQMDMNNSKYEAEKENIENTVTNESVKNSKLKKLDADYNKTQEKLFERQKQAKIATA